MKYTLLELVQSILSSMDSDEVNSITDTVEARQVAEVVKSAYVDIVSKANLPEHYSMFSLLSAPTTAPTVMRVPETVDELLWVKYNKETTDDTDMAYTPIGYLPLEQFLSQMHSLSESDTDVDTFNLSIAGSTIPILYRNNKAPDYYTTYDDNVVLFDSLDSSVDSRLSASKTTCYGRLTPTFTFADNFVPDLDATQFALLLNEAKSLAWTELKQVEHPKAEKSARRQWVRVQNTKDRVRTVPFVDTTPNYGRK